MMNVTFGIDSHIALCIHAEGVKCNSQGQRPWIRLEKEFISAESAKCFCVVRIKWWAIEAFYSAPLALGNYFLTRDLGRWPRLLHLAPSALSIWAEPIRYLEGASR